MNQGLLKEDGGTNQVVSVDLEVKLDNQLKKVPPGLILCPLLIVLDVNKHIVHIMMESLIETSAKQGVGVEDAFKMLSKNILDRIENGDISLRLWCSLQA